MLPVVRDTPAANDRPASAVGAKRLRSGDDRFDGNRKRSRLVSGRDGGTLMSKDCEAGFIFPENGHLGAHAKIKGLIVPVLTPFDDVGEIDQRAFIRHLEFLAQHGVHRIMVNGTTAEFYSLLPQERKTLLKVARRYFPGLIVLHIGGTGLAQNKEEMAWAAEYGADAVAALPPIYPAGLCAEGLIDYFCALEAETDLPFILYNFPKHTGNPITREILKSVPHFAMKDSAQDLSLMPHTPRYFIGSSTNVYEPVQMGAAGFVSATANVRPELYSAMETLVVDAKIAEAALLQEEIRAYSTSFSAGGVPLLKAALARKLSGYPVNVRTPLRPNPS